MENQTLDAFKAMEVDQNRKALQNSIDKSFLISNHESSLTQITSILISANLSNKFYQTIVRAFSGSKLELQANKSATLRLNPSDRVDIETLAGNVDKELIGKFFLCRTITPTFHLNGNSTVADDPNGKFAVRLSLYNSGWPDPMILKEDMAVGRILAIRNPLFNASPDGGFALRSKNLSDILIISEKAFQEIFPGLRWESEIPKKYRKLINIPPQTIIEWKNYGNKLFVAEKFQQAVYAYTEGLDLVLINGEFDGPHNQSDLVVDMLTNRALAYVNLQCFNKGIEDTERVLKIDSGHIKATVRKVKALFGLGSYSDAVFFLREQLPKTKRENKIILSDLISKAQNLHTQKSTGEFNFLSLTRMTKVNQDDLAEFVGPVEIQLIPGRGRGLVATEEILPGQLIMVSKGFAIVNEPKYYLVTKSTNNERRNQLVDRIAEKLLMEPSLCQILYGLYAGSEFPVFKSGEDVHVDIKRIEAVCTYNVLTIEKSLKNPHIITAHNTNKLSTGLWILPSYINHSCWDCNCIWKLFETMMFIRACRKIAPGEEILISYNNPTVNYKERSKLMKKHGFVCQCRLCLLDREKSPLALERMKLLKQIERCFKKNEESEKIVKLLNQLGALQMGKERSVMNPVIAYPLTQLAEYFHVVKRELGKPLEFLLKCHAITEGSSLTEIAIISSINIIGNYLLRGKIKDVVKWIRILKQDLTIYYGTPEMAKVVAKDTLNSLSDCGIPFF